MKSIAIAIMLLGVGCAGSDQINPSTTNAASSYGTVIQVDGTTSLNRVGENFYLYDTQTGTGPALHFQGTIAVASQFGAFTPIGAIKTSTGYEVAWSEPGMNMYTIWTVDAAGNYVTNSPGVVGTDPSLEAAETTFHQDLNGDGRIGP